MKFLDEGKEIEITPELQKRFNRFYRDSSFISYLPEVLLFLPMPVLLIVIQLFQKIGFPHYVNSLLWLTLFSNAFIFLLVFTRDASKIKKKQLRVFGRYRLFSFEGQLIPSSIESVQKSFCYFENYYGEKVAVTTSSYSDKIKYNSYGKVILILDESDNIYLLQFDEGFDED